MKGAGLSYVEYHFITDDQKDLSVTFSDCIPSHPDAGGWLVQVWNDGKRAGPLIRERFDGMVTVGAAQFFALRALTLVKG